MNKPTDEQIKKFWEWCGFKLEQRQDPYWKDMRRVRINPDDSYSFDDDSFPSLDLNNIFKYAVPKLFNKGLDVVLKSDNGMFWVDIVKQTAKIDKTVAHTICYNEPELPLFWAIMEVIERC